ncbi:chemotaxis protein CheW [Azovibrio restrictus]|uniref:chemotaxis protein CheW n=1 Tax=Azovibrio restrictus TaxID=146938 RepID=UPI0026EB8CBA|nr:chemotaxis protein CheW [Azovibrio restrictus]MDD3483604.1 chemotaxis protein CheW [Azovibrio restrictus]
MARRISLREFQEHLSRRLSGVAQGESASSLLGVQAGQSFWLLDLSESGEIVPLPSLAPVPLTHKAFAGLANIRGNLHAVTDFPAFLGEEPTALHNPAARLLLVGAKHGNNVALLVTRLLGLKNPADFEAGTPPAQAPAWNAATLVDPDGREWHRLDLKALLSDPQFMNIVA